MRFLGLVLLALAGCTQDAEPSSPKPMDLIPSSGRECFNDSDCLPGQVCDVAYCVPAPPDFAIPADMSMPPAADLADDIQCVPECPPGWRCTLVGCVPGDAPDLARVDPPAPPDLGRP